MYRPGLRRKEAALILQSRQNQLLRITLPEAILLLQPEVRAAQPIHPGPTALHLQGHPLRHHTIPGPAHQVLRVEEAILQDHQAGAILQVAALTLEAHQAEAHHQAEEGKGN